MAVSVVLPVYNQLALTRACLDSLRGTSEPFELCVVDNASTDGTEAYFARLRPLPRPLRYHRNADERRSHPRPQPGRRASPRGDVLCFLHNDTEMRDVALAGAAAGAPWRSPASGWPDSTAPGACVATAATSAARIVHCAGRQRQPARRPSRRWRAVDGVCLARAPRRARRRSGASTRATASSTATTASCRSPCARRAGAAWSWTRPSSIAAAARAPGRRRRSARPTRPRAAPGGAGPLRRQVAAPPARRRPQPRERVADWLAAAHAPLARCRRSRLSRRGRGA